MKNEQVTITVPHPCSQDWDKMTPTDKGRHCAACQTTVIDFSILTDAQIIDTLREIAGGHFCGHYHESQLGRDISKYQHSLSFVPATIKGIAACILFLQTVITSAFAQTAKPKPKTEQHAKPKTQQSKEKPKCITGHIKDNLTGVAIPGVTISIQSTDISTTTDKTGAFTLPVPDSFSARRVTLVSHPPFAQGTYIPDKEMGLDTALATANVIIYRYPVQQADQQTIVSYHVPLISGGSRGATRVIISGEGVPRPPITEASEIRTRKTLFHRMADFFKFRKKHRS